MKCLRCGNCCKTCMVMIVNDPDQGVSEDNIIFQSGQDGQCKHLKGNKPGEYSCAIHDYSWYDETPCFQYGQIEKSPDTECRTGRFIMSKEDGSS